jgi:hypothetical protein
VRKSEFMRWVSVKKGSCKCRLLIFPVELLEEISTTYRVIYLKCMIIAILNTRTPRLRP